MKPLLKWAGGKARLAVQICDAYDGPCTGTYYEPFVGSGAVYLHRRAAGTVRRAVLSDVNDKLIEMHRAIRDDVHAVLSALDDLPGEDWRERYYEVRTAFNEGPWYGPEHAARFIWLNRACFNGLYRENRLGHFNVPVGRYKRLSIPKRDHFLRVSELLEGTRLIVASYEEVLSDAAEEDQVYCDPPYVPLTATACFTSYSKESFGHAHQIGLADCAVVAAERGANVVLSNHDLPLVRNEIYPAHRGFEVVARPRVTRAISRSSASRGAVGEVIARIGPHANVLV